MGVVVGMLLSIAFVLLGSVSVSGSILVLPLLFSVGYATTLLWRVRRRSIAASQRRKRGHCGKCDYNLTGNVSGICPECGTRYRAADDDGFFAKWLPRLMNAPWQRLPRGLGQMACGGCGYNLMGLPATHVCPECGIQYDEHSVVIPMRHSHSRKDLYIATGVSIAAVAGLWYLLYRLNSPDIVIIGLPLAVAGPASWLLQSYFWMRRTPDEPLRMTVDRRGLQCIHPELSGELIPWSDIGSVRWSWITGAILVEGTNGKLIFRCSNEFLDCASRPCVREINRLAEVYSSGE